MESHSVKQTNDGKDGEVQRVEQGQIPDTTTGDSLAARFWTDYRATEAAIDDQRWARINEQLKHRYELLITTFNRLSKHVIDPTVGIKLAATDVFVEKAQHQLTVRSRILMGLGVTTAVLTIGILLGAAVAVFRKTPLEMLGGMSTRYTLTMAIIKAISIGGFVGGAVYFLGGLSSSLFHESLVLLNRRHALRFGRLSVYLQGGDIDPKLLQELFRWNDEFTTAFKTIQAEEIKKGGLAGVIEPPSKTLEGVAKVVESAKTTALNPPGRA